MPTLAYCWTLNNWTPLERQQILDINDTKVQYICLAEEIGAQGTPHLQGYIQLKKQCKYTTIKSNWQGWSRVHFEQYTMGSDDDNYDYVHGPYTKNGKNKPLNETFVEKGERISMGRKGARNDLKEVKEAIDRGESYDEICETHFTQVAMYSKFIKERIQARESGRLLDSLREQYNSSSLMPWQSALVDYLDEGVDPRKIAWIWDKEGNSGKSWMAKYLVATKNACYLSFGRKSDLIYIFAQDPKPIVVFNLSRTTAPTTEEHEQCKKNFLDGIYSLAEDLKDGILVNTKYEAKTVLFQVPHVIFFANFEPDRTKWSADRYDVTNMSTMDFTCPN